MSRTVLGSIVGLSLLLTVLLACGGLGLAVREGFTDEVLVQFPRGDQRQLIFRIGSDAPPWDRRQGRPTAINLWVHDNDTDWHIINLVSIPLGSGPPEPD